MLNCMSNDDSADELDIDLTSCPKFPRLDEAGDTDNDLVDLGSKLMEQVAEEPHLKVMSSFPSVAKERATDLLLPHPFPLPSNYRSDVKLGLRIGTVTREAKKAFLSSVAAKNVRLQKLP